jgi:hypothetical protein
VSRRSLYLLALTSFVLACQSQSSAPLPRVDHPLPYLAEATLDGRLLDVAPLRGKVVVVNFWSPS